MSHYYTNDETLNHDVQTIDVKIRQTTLKLETDRGVFSKMSLDYGTRVLLENIDLSQEPLKVVDMGCGYGPIGLYIAKTYPNTCVYMSDINQRAVDLAIKNSRINQLKNVSINQGFLFENIVEEVDIVLTNPPIRAGKQTIFALYEQAFQKLKTGGILYVVIQKKQGAPSTVAKLESLFGHVTILDKIKGYWILSAKK
ncbi:MAG: class I SAM-dependent methyltransferase [Bacillota bacterium]|nr:MAG: class I SAM-dependent methyltransferase [Bacillota bacterium]